MTYKFGNALNDALEIINDKTIKPEDVLEKLKRNTEHIKKLKFQTMYESSVYQIKMLAAGIEIENSISILISDIRNANSGFLGSKKKLLNMLNRYFEIEKSYKELKEEIQEFQCYALTPFAIASSDDVEMLIEISDEIKKNANISFELINRKISEISNSRLAITNLIISIVAIIIAVVFSRK